MTHTSTSSAESEASHSRQSGRGFARWHMRNLTPKRRWCCTTSGRQSRTSETFAPSDGPAFSARMDALHSLQQAYRASLRLFLASGWVVPTSGGCGLTRSQSFASYDPALASLKTRQQSLALMMDGPSLESSVDWPRSGMMCCGEAFSLPPWMQDISGSGAASLLPTACASDGDGGKRPMKGMSLTGKLEDGRKVTVALPTKIRMLMPTPTAQDGERGGRGDLLAISRGKPNKLCQWATIPTPTPTAADGKRGPDYAKSARGSGGDDLVTFMAKAKLLPTPTTRDYKDTPGMDTARDGKEGGRLDQLPRVIFAAESAVPIGGIKLTPEFQCWLMGFPPDWLKRLRVVLAMPLSRKPSTRSSKPSTPT